MNPNHIPENFPLDRILHNPFQTRQHEDLEHVERIALSIARQGLLQAPAGRLVQASLDAKNYVDSVQLAYGNTRFASFSRLHHIEKALRNGMPLEVFENDDVYAQIVAAVGTAIEQGRTFAAMPVVVRDLSDEEMFEWAVRENNDRKDLTVFETARAMTTYRDQFAKTSAQIGDLFQLSDSAVRNTIRLLNLPKDQLADLEAGSLSARSASALLSLFDLPESMRKKAEQSYYMDQATKPSAIVRDACAGESSDRIRERIDQLVKRFGQDLKEAKFDYKEKFELRGAILAETCAGCELMQLAGKRKLCLDTSCYLAKTAQHKARYLARAEAASGIKARGPDDGESDGAHGSFEYDSAYVPKIREAGCERLRLLYDDSVSYKSATLADLKFPHAVLACKSPKQFCTCLQGVKALEERQRQESILAHRQEQLASAKPLTEVFAAEEDQAPEETPAEPTVEDLQQLAQEARAEKRARKARFEEIRAAYAGLVEERLRANDPSIWRYLLDAAGGDSEGEIRTVAEYQADLADRLSRRDFYYDSPSITLEDVLAMFNRRLREHGLPQLAMHGEQVQTHDPAGDLLRGLERLEKYVRYLQGGQQSAPELLSGNLEVLRDLEAKAADLDAVDHGRYYYDKIKDPRLAGVPERIAAVKADLEALEAEPAETPVDEWQSVK